MINAKPSNQDGNRDTNKRKNYCNETNNISVIIPSYERHKEVLRAVRSALEQTNPPLEILVINDGPDKRKAKLIAELNNSCVKYMEAPRTGRAAATRNYGITHARGEWIALLDDDDIWLPWKLERQMVVANKFHRNAIIIGGMERVHFPDGRTRVRPNAPSATPEVIGDFLFASYGKEGVNTSTLMARRKFFTKYPLDVGLERHEDWQWLLDVETNVGARIVIAPDIICERRIQINHGLSRPGGFSFSKKWYERNRDRLSPRARHWFVAGILSRKAAWDLQWSALPWLVAENSRAIPFSVLGYSQLFLPWVIPQWLRHTIKITLRKCALRPS